MHCGQFLVPMRWMASSPVADPPRPEASHGAYTGPPRYSGTPSWGFPALPWQRDRPVQGPTAADRAAGHAGLLIPLLRGLAMLAVLSAAAEIWRYVLLLQSRGGALSAGAVSASDALVEAASWVSTLMFVASGVYLLVWLLPMIDAAALRSGVRSSRSHRTVLLGWLVPGINLSVPGSVLAELEHAALGRPAGQRPRPSKLVLVWWGLWAANVILGALVLLWSLRSGVQARADGVVQHAVLDLVAAGTAVATARVVEWLTALVCPPRVVPRQRVVRIREPAPTP